MDYFTAVQIGKARAKKAVDKLQESAGPSYAVLFLKTGIPDWTPVGEEELFALVDGKEGKAAVVICDGEGNSKAMSSWLGRDEAERISGQLKARGIVGYKGEVKLPV